MITSTKIGTPLRKAGSRSIALVFLNLLVFNITDLFGQAPLLDVEGGIKIGHMTSPPEPGTMRFNGKNFEGWNGLTWVSLGNFKLAGTVQDFDGNVYQTIQVGNKEWMAENLRTLHYNDGSDMAIHVSDFVINFGSPGDAYYPNDQFSNVPTYGVLYNFECIETNKLCPTGWHAPNNTEWQALVDNIGGTEIAGARMKEVGTGQWQTPNTEACNESGFTARGAGFWDVNSFDPVELRKIGIWWSTTTNGSGFASQWFVEFNDVDISEDVSLSNAWGFSVRCVKN